MKRFLSLISLFAALGIQAQTTVTVDDVLYLISDDHAAIARQDKGLKGDIIIPSTITYNAKDYPVSSIVDPTNAYGVADCTFWCEGGAFQETNVHSVTLPESISHIPMGTFSDAPLLERVEITGPVDRIWHGTFSRCPLLTDVVLPESVEAIEVYAFGDCPSLESFDFPSNLQSISEGAFKWSGLKHIDIPRTVSWIGEEAFGETPLETVKLNYIDLEGKGCAVTAFNEVKDCELLVRQGSITVFENELPWSEFAKITGFDDGNPEVVISNKLNIEYEGIRYTIYRDSRTAMIGRQNGKASGDIVIPEYVEHEGEPYRVTSMIEPSTMTCVADGGIHCLDGVFQNCDITSISLPDGITTIPVGAFYNCQYLTGIKLPAALTVIEAGAFAYCYSLEALELPETLTDLGSASFGYGYHSFVFGNCTSLKSLIIPAGVREIAAGCFQYSGIEELELPEGIESIGDFSIWTTGLKTLKLHTRNVFSLRYSDRSIGNVVDCTLMVPLGCRQLYSELYPWMDFAAIEEYDDGDVYVPDVMITSISSIRYILDLEDLVAVVARQNKDMEGEVVIPEVVEVNGQAYPVTALVEPTFVVAIAGNEVDTEGGAFQSTNITSVSLPSSITTIPAGSFRNCRDLTKVTLPENLTSIGGGAFSDCTSLEEIYLPETLTSLSSDSGYGPLSYVFGGCTALKKVNIPEGVDRIPGGCFKWSGLNSFIITDNIRYLEPNCFDLPELEYVKITHKDLSNLEFTESIFPESISNVTLLVPEGSKELYSQFYPWKDFRSIEEYKESNDKHHYNAYRLFIEWLIEKVEEIIEDVTEEHPRQRVVRYVAETDEEDSYLDYLPSGKNIEAISAPEIEGLKFVKWEEVPSHMPSEDVTLRAVYMQNIPTSVEGAGVAEEDVREIFDMQGRPTHSVISTLSPGIYIVKLANGSVRKIFVE